MILLLAKAPLPGLAKTRLIPALGADGAAALAARLLQHAMAQALDAALGPVRLWATPDPAHPAFDAWRHDPRVNLHRQPEGDLGNRMRHAFEWGLRAQPGQPLLMMGTDAPALVADRLREAAAALQDHDAVFVPAHDGGYALIGLSGRQPVPGFPFEDMPWSTAAVMSTTRARLAAAGWRHRELATVHDVDEAPDLAHLPAGWLEDLCA